MIIPSWTNIIILLSTNNAGALFHINDIRNGTIWEFVQLLTKGISANSKWYKFIQ